MTFASSARELGVCALAAGLLCACSYLPEIPSLGAIKPYRIDIQQGNFLSQEMVSQLKKGMTREQVRFVLGTPMVADIFHADRWDYVYYRELGNGRKEHRTVSVVFEQDRLARVLVLGDVLPVKPAADALPGAAPKPDAPKAEAVGAEKSEVKN